jgi:hypothetical protein
MSETPVQPNHDKDEALAKLADRLMSGAPSGTGDLPPKEEDEELHKLGKTLLQMRRLRQNGKPPAASQQKIRSRLVAEWRKAGPTAQPNGWQKLLGWIRQPGWSSAGRQRRVYAFSAVALTVIVLIVAVAVSPTINTNVFAAAGQGSAWLPIALALGLVGALIIIGLIRRKKK